MGGRFRFLFDSRRSGGSDRAALRHPFSVDAKVIQHTIQLVPRLSEPTLVTAVLVEPNVPVKKGQPLFQFDRRPYEYKVNQLQAQLAQAKQNVLILQADVDVATQKVDKAESDLKFSRTMREASVPDMCSD